MEPRIISKQYSEYYKKILGILERTNKYYLIGKSISENEKIYMRIIDGKAEFKGGESALKFLKGYDTKKIEYEVISFAAMMYNEEVPEQMELAEENVEYAQKYMEFLENNTTEIKKMKENENINTEEAIFGMLYSERREFENKKAIETETTQREYYIS